MKRQKDTYPDGKVYINMTVTEQEVVDLLRQRGLTLAYFFLLGLALLPEALHHLSWSYLAIILASLFVVRPLAIWLSLIGTDASATTRMFFGWFGPRGLATALFALLVVPQVDHELAEPILTVAINAVWISALLHGLSAQPGAKWYAARVAAMGDCAETKPIETSAKPLVTKDPNPGSPGKV